MRAVTWHGRRDVRVEDVPDAKIEDGRDAVVRVTSTAICGSDLHLYELFGPFIDAGDVLGHEAMGVVEAVGDDVDRVKVGDRVVVPFNIACGACFMCAEQLYSQCETTQVREYGTGGALFGYTKLYGQVPGGQAELVRVPFADVGLIAVPDTVVDDQVLFLSDVLPTAWQAAVYAGVEPGATVAVLGLGPIGQMAARVARYLGGAVTAVDLVDERLAMARRHAIDVVDAREVRDVPTALRERTGGRGPDAVIDAVGMEAHGSPSAAVVQKFVGLLPDQIAAPMMQRAGLDRLAALHSAIEAVRRGGTLSISGVYGGALDPMPMMQLFDKQVTIRMGQANVLRWVDVLLPLVLDPSDPLGVLDLTTHRLPLAAAPDAYRAFQRKQDGTIKVVLQP